MKREPGNHDQQKLLAKLISMQIAGYIILEFIVAFLVLINALPAFLPVRSEGIITAEINTYFIVIVGLASVLISAFWVAVLNELAGMIQIKKF
jgi:hypothetical protein